MNTETHNTETSNDLTLLDKFAMASLPGLLATTDNPNASGLIVDGATETPSIASEARFGGWDEQMPRWAEGNTWASFIAGEAYDIARAMMRERAEQGKYHTP